MLASQAQLSLPFLTTHVIPTILLLALLSAALTSSLHRNPSSFPASIPSLLCSLPPSLLSHANQPQDTEQTLWQDTVATPQVLPPSLPPSRIALPPS